MTTTGPIIIGYSAELSAMSSPQTSLSSTFAQIVDGLPIADVAYQRRFHGLDNDHPIEDHAELCGGVMERTREIRTQF